MYFSRSYTIEFANRLIIRHACSWRILELTAKLVIRRLNKYASMTPSDFPFLLRYQSQIQCFCLTFPPSNNCVSTFSLVSTTSCPLCAPSYIARSRYWQRFSWRLLFRMQPNAVYKYIYRSYQVDIKIQRCYQ